MTTSTDKHTPGEWHMCRPVGPAMAFPIETDDAPIAVVHGGPFGEANARLIRSVPALLALARQYASECGECSGSGVSQDYHQDCESCRDIRAVIARATNSEAAQ